MDSETAHGPSCSCDKPDCLARQDLQRKADWMGVPFAHAEEIERTLKYTSEILPEVTKLGDAASILLKLVPILQARKDLDRDMHTLLVECCKFHSVLVHHVSTQSEGISPLAAAAVRTISHIVTVLYAMTSTTFDRNLWKKLISTGGHNGSVPELHEKLRAAWKGVYPEMASVDYLLHASPGDSMNDQMDAMLEKMVIIIRDGAHHGEYEFLQDLESNLNNSPFYVPAGLNARALENTGRDWNGVFSSPSHEMNPNGQEGNITPRESYTLSNPVLEYQSASDLQPYFGTPANIPAFSRENIRVSEPHE